MDILSNREIAIGLWLLAISLYVFLSSKMTEVRASFGDVLSAFFVRPIISVLCMMIAYVTIVIYWLSELELWNFEQLKNTVFWIISVGFVSLLNIEKFKKDKRFFKHLVIDNLQLLAILQFIVGVYSFTLWIEVLLVPVLTLIGAMITIAETDKKYHQAKILLEYCLSLFGVVLTVYTLYMLASNFAVFGSERTAYDFFIPPLLTLCYLPFIFTMMVYSSYQQVFVHLNFSIKDRFLRCVSKLYATVIFNLRISLLERWSYHVSRVKIESHSDLVDTFRHIFKVRYSERTPKEVPIEKGWSPYIAKDFLLNQGLNTGFYNKLFEEEWRASSPMEEFSDGVMPDNIAYYVEGSEDVANVLTLIVNVNDSARSHQACKKLQEMAEALSISSLKQPLSKNMKNAISNCEPHSEECDGKSITLHVERWRDHKFHGYDLKFMISSV